MLWNIGFVVSGVLIFFPKFLTVNCVLHSSNLCAFSGLKESSSVRAATVLDFIGHDPKLRDLALSNDKSKVANHRSKPLLTKHREVKQPRAVN